MFNKHPTRRHALNALVTLASGSYLLGASSPALAWPFSDKHTIRGSGRVVQDKRPATGFHAVAANLPCTVNLVQGNSEGVDVEADDNLLAAIETVVEDGTLQLRWAKGYRVTGTNRIRMTVYLRQVDSLSVASSADLSANSLQAPRLDGSIAGSGRIAIHDLRNERLSVSIAGSGDFEVHGTGQTLEVSIAGSGDLRAAHFAAQQATVDIAGSGNATLWVRQALTVSIAGSGDVRYYGESINPTVSVMGSGRVRSLGVKPPAA